MDASLSARRAWIEIAPAGHVTWQTVVALRKESVDRNYAILPASVRYDGRSPQGERG